jgi:hypothetical protein
MRSPLHEDVLFIHLGIQEIAYGGGRGQQVTPKYPPPRPPGGDGGTGFSQLPSAVISTVIIIMNMLMP